MKRVIVESPYGHRDPAVVERNKRYLRACMRDCLLRGESPYASHGLYTQEGVLDDNVPEERELGIQAGFVWRRSAHATVVYKDLGISNGMAYGIQAAVSLCGEDGEHTLEFRTLGGEWAQDV